MLKSEILYLVKLSFKKWNEDIFRATKIERVWHLITVGISKGWTSGEGKWTQKKDLKYRKNDKKSVNTGENLNKDCPNKTVTNHRGN